MSERFKLLRLMMDRKYSPATIETILLICGPYADKEAIKEKLIALIEQCKTEQEALAAVNKYYPMPE